MKKKICFFIVFLFGIQSFVFQANYNKNLHNIEIKKIIIEESPGNHLKDTQIYQSVSEEKEVKFIFLEQTVWVDPQYVGFSNYNSTEDNLRFLLKIKPIIFLQTVKFRPQSARMILDKEEPLPKNC